MDYWCALWFWPIEKAEELPTRQEFLFDVQMLLGMDVISTRVNKKTGQIGLFDYGSVIDPYVQDMVEGSMSVLVMTKEGIYAARDRLGRTPVILGHKEDGYCITFESSAFLNLGYRHYRDLGPGEIDFVTPEWVEVVKQPGEEDLFVPVGILRLSDIHLRRHQCRVHAQPLRRPAGQA